MNVEFYDNLRNLIRESCVFEGAPSPVVQHFHKEFLKKSLEALDVYIDYHNKCITSWSTRPVQMDASTIYKLRDSVNPIICYEDLESTLLGCIQENDFFQRQYESLITSYQTQSRKNGSNFYNTISLRE